MAHPGAPLKVGEAAAGAPAGVLLAVGPEGGWNEFERTLLAAHGFRAAGLSGGALRSDVACIALLALVRDAYFRP
jgi:16S rRNA (uracil1498-N3)-methyltransferase